MKVSKVSHISIACRDLERHLRLFSTVFGLPHGDVIEVPSQGVKVVVIESRNVKIELVAPLDEKANLNKFLEKHGEGLHHICLNVHDVKAALTELASDGVEAIDREPRPGAEGRLVAFLHPKSTGSVLIELEEE